MKKAIYVLTLMLSLLAIFLFANPAHALSLDLEKVKAYLDIGDIVLGGLLLVVSLIPGGVVATPFLLKFRTSIGIAQKTTDEFADLIDEHSMDTKVFIRDLRTKGRHMAAEELVKKLPQKNPVALS